MLGIKMKKYIQHGIQNVSLMRKDNRKNGNLPLIGKQGASFSQESLQATPSEKRLMLGAIVVKDMSWSINCPHCIVMCVNSASVDGRGSLDIST